MGNTGPQTRERRLERVACKRVCVLLRSKTAAQPQRGDAMNCRHQNPESGIGLRVPVQQSGIDDALDVGGELPFHLVNKTETLPVFPDWRHRSIEEHQRVVLGVLLAELVETPEAGPDLFDGIDRGRFAAGGEKHPKPFLGERKEDVVFAFEIAVNSRRAVFDFFRDLPNRNVLISLSHEELAGSIQNRPRHRFPFPFLTFLDSQRPSFLSKMQC